MYTFFGSFLEFLETVQSVREFSKYPETFQCLKTFQWLKTFKSVQKLFRVFLNFPKLSRNLSKCSEAYQKVPKLSRLPGNFPEGPETFQRVQKNSIVSWNFPKCLETFQSVQQLFKVSRNFLGCPVTFQREQKLPWVSKEIAIFCAFFNAPMQKLFELQKAFWRALLGCLQRCSKCHALSCTYMVFSRHICQIDIQF